jgi:hypothetical protein
MLAREENSMNDTKNTTQNDGNTGRAAADSQIPLVQDIIDAIREIWKRGNANRLDIEKDGKTVLSISLVVGTIGLVLAPVAAFIGFGAAMISEYIIKITLDNGTVTDVNEFAVTHKKTTEPKDARDVTPEEE